MSALAVLAAAVVLLCVALAFAGLSGAGIATPSPGASAPARSRDEAVRRLAAAQSRSAECTAPECVSALMEPGTDVEPLGTCILIHGFTNCPAQFADVAALMRAKGYRVLVPRMPRHGRIDVMTPDLAGLTTGELEAFANEIVDIASGLGGPVRIVGLSAGAIIAAWAGAFRAEVDRVALIAPIAAPTGVPMPVVRLLIRLHAVLPRLWIWWDPRLKANLGESPYVYPGFHLPGLVPYLHLAQALRDRRIEPTNRLARVVLLTNPNDFAVRRDVARALTLRAFTDHADVVAEARVAESLGWWHDFVDPYGKHGASAEQVEQIIEALLGTGDPAANGLLGTPAPPAVDGS